jgi:zinc protease
VLPDRFAEATALLADVALRPALDPEAFERLRDERIASVIGLGDDPSFVAGRLADRFVFGEGHPYGTGVLGTRGSLARLSPEDARDAYARLGPRCAALVTVGPLSTDAARAAISPLFAAWHTSATPPPEPPALSPGPRPRLVLVDRPGAVQSVVVVAEPSLSRRNPDALAARVANKAIGGAFTSRINESLRERHGLSYGASSAFQLQTGPGAFVAETAVQTDATARAVKELLGQLDHAFSDPLSPDELDKARALVAWDVSQGMETSAGAAAAFAEVWAQALPDDELATFGRRLAALSSASVHRALRGALRPDARTVVVVGDAAAVEQELAAIGLGAPLRLLPDGSAARPPPAPPRSP